MGTIIGIIIIALAIFGIYKVSKGSSSTSTSTPSTGGNTYTPTTGGNEYGYNDTKYGDNTGR